MRKIPEKTRFHYAYCELPLFRWASQIPAPPLTVGGRYVHRRTGLPPAIANTVAELAGIGPEGKQ